MVKIWRNTKHQPQEWLSRSYFGFVFNQNNGKRNRIVCFLFCLLLVSGGRLPCTSNVGHLDHITQTCIGRPCLAAACTHHTPHTHTTHTTHHTHTHTTFHTTHTTQHAPHTTHHTPHTPHTRQEHLALTSGSHGSLCFPVKSSWLKKSF